jgi:hypothetical protein
LAEGFKIEGLFAIDLFCQATSLDNAAKPVTRRMLWE